MSNRAVSIASPALLSLELFRGLGAYDVSALCTVARGVRYPRGSVVFQQGDPADHLLLVVRGQLQAWAVVGERRELVADVFAGELVGEASLYPGAGMRMATLTAVSETVAVRLTRADLDAMSGSRALAAIQRKMLESTARRLRSTNHAMRRIWKRGRATSHEESATEAGSPWSRLVRALGELT